MKKLKQRAVNELQCSAASYILHLMIQLGKLQRVKPCMVVSLSNLAQEALEHNNIVRKAMHLSLPARPFLHNPLYIQ